MALSASHNMLIHTLHWSIDNFTGGQENCDKMFKRNRDECLCLNGIL